MVEDTAARPVAPRGGAVRFCWKSVDDWGRERTLSLRARDCPDPVKIRTMIADLLEANVWVEPVV